MLLLPGQRHGFGDMQEYFFWRMADYFARYLLGDYENTVDIRRCIMINYYTGRLLTLSNTL